MSSSTTTPISRRRWLLRTCPVGPLAPPTFRRFVEGPGRVTRRPGVRLAARPSDSRPTFHPAWRDTSSCGSRRPEGARRMLCPERNGACPREGDQMAYGIVHYFADGTEEQYEASIAAVHPSRGSLPDGQIFHAAGPSDGGWTIMAVHSLRELGAVPRQHLDAPVGRRHRRRLAAPHRRPRSKCTTFSRSGPAWFGLLAPQADVSVGS